MEWELTPMSAAQVRSFLWQCIAFLVRSPSVSRILLYPERDRNRFLNAVQTMARRLARHHLQHLCGLFCCHVTVMFQTWIPHAPFGRLTSVDDNVLQCSSYLQNLMCLSGSCLQVYVVTLSKELTPTLLPQHHQFKVFTNICMFQLSISMMRIA